MEVGFASDVRFLPSKPEPMEKIYRQTIEVAVLAEELGFAHFWASEHHFAEDGWSSSPLVLLAGIATRTSKIRLGSYVTLLAMHNPCDTRKMRLPSISYRMAG